MRTFLIIALLISNACLFTDILFMDVYFRRMEHAHQTAMNITAVQQGRIDYLERACKNETYY